MNDLDQSKAPLLDHLIELRKRLLWALAALAVAFAVCLYFARPIFAVLVQPLLAAGQGKIIYTDIFEAFFVEIKVAFFSATMVAAASRIARSAASRRSAWVWRGVSATSVSARAGEGRKVMPSCNILVCEQASMLREGNAPTECRTSAEAAPHRGRLGRICPSQLTAACRHGTETRAFSRNRTRECPRRRSRGTPP